jgi:flagellar operon protein (TIGR03826 family)
MEMANCIRCKKVFQRIKEPICEQCKKKDEELFVVVRKYLEEHPSSTIHQISTTTGASTKKIMTWLREGRLEIAETTGDLKCRQCGVDISTGQFCEACTIEIKRQIGGLYDEKPDLTDNAFGKKGVVMHTKKRR